jgi:hypothetical protein
MLERVDSGQHKGCAKAACEPGKRARPKAGTQGRHALIDRRDVISPILRVSLLDGRQTLVDLCQLRIFLGLRQGPVEGRAVDLALKIGGIAQSRIFLRHTYPCCPGLSG